MRDGYRTRVGRRTAAGKRGLASVRRIQNKSGKKEGCRTARLGEYETDTEQEWEGDRRARGRG